MSDKAALNRSLGITINQEVWNQGRTDRLPRYFTDDFVSDRRPYGLSTGLDELRAAVERSHAAFSDFKEEIRAVVADEERVVIHFTIKGRHTGRWGPIPPTDKYVEFDEIVIMEVRNAKISRLTGVIDT